MQRFTSVVGWRAALVLLGLASLASGSARAQALVGDCNGDGMVDAADEALLAGSYGSQLGDANYGPHADLNADGAVDVLDLALFGENFGASGGAVDTTPPSLFVSLNDIPDDMNDLLVAPPDAFRITLEYDGTGSAIDVGSLSVTSDHDVGALTAGSELAAEFSATPMRASWEVPAGSDLEPTSHFLTVSIRDHAGNPIEQVYGFAVRDFPANGAPLANPQTVFLDFDQDRSLGTEIDFLEDLRHYHLSSASSPAIESQMRDWIVSEILMRVHPFFDRQPDGSPGSDPVNIAFTDSDPGGLRSRLCVGGESQFGSAYLGSTILDVNNVAQAQDDCVFGAYYGVFPQAIDNLWGASAGFLDAFSPLDPALGGTPVGEHALDATVLAPGFDPDTAPAAEKARWVDIADATDAFAQVLATVIAHETGHMLGLVAHGDAPAGLFGGVSGGETDHNVSSGGETPSETYLMNKGSSFGFDDMTGRGGATLPVFRAMNWAYLRDRLVLDSQVTGLYPAPALLSVSPDPVVYGGSPASVQVTLSGDDFLATPVVELYLGGNPPAKTVLSESLVDPQTVTGFLNPLLVPPGLYDVQLTNPDGQSTTLVDGVLVQP